KTGPVVGPAPPTQLDGLPGGGRGQIDQGISKPAGVAAPGFSAGQRIAEISIDRSWVGIADETAARGQNIGEIVGANFDFEHAAIIAVGGQSNLIFEIVVVPEKELGGACRKIDRRRN